MGEIDMVLNRYFEDGERYADLINGYAFNGDQVVRKEDVQELDPRETGVAGRQASGSSEVPRQHPQGSAGSQVCADRAGTSGSGPLCHAGAGHAAGRGGV